MDGGTELWQFTTSDVVTVIALGVLAMVFVIAGWNKIRHPAVAGFALVQFGIARRVRKDRGFVLGTLEVFVGIGLTGVLGSRVLVLTAATAVLACAIYLGLVVQAHRRGSVEVCTCFSAQGAPLDGWAVGRNAVLLWLSISAFSASMTSGPSWSERGEGLMVAIAVLGTAAAFRLAHSSMRSWRQAQDRLDWPRLRALVEGGV